MSVSNTAITISAVPWLRPVTLPSPESEMIDEFVVKKRPPSLSVVAFTLVSSPICIVIGGVSTLMFDGSLLTVTLTFVLFARYWSSPSYLTVMNAVPPIIPLINPLSSTVTISRLPLS